MELNYHALWGAFLVAFAVALAFTPVSMWLAPKIGALDIPKDDRRVHTKAMPRFGGMAIFLGIMASIVFCLLPQYGDKTTIYGVIIGGVIIFAGGVIDDLKELSAKLKLISQIVSGVVVYAFGLRFNFIGLAMGGTETVLGTIAVFLLTVIWIVGLVNAMNLIDGLDGLAAGIAAISSLCIAYAGYIHGHYAAAIAMLGVAGGALGFLPFNFNPAKTFMGDCGSQFLGYCLAVFALVQPVKSATIMAIVLPVIVMGIPIFDTIFAILRRLVRRQSIVQGDKEHLHHRIMRAGYGQKRSVLLMYSISAIMGCMAVAYSRGNIVECLGLLGIVVILMYVLMTDTSANHMEIHAVNIAREEKKAEAAEKKNMKKYEREHKHSNKKQDQDGQ